MRTYHAAGKHGSPGAVLLVLVMASVLFVLPAHAGTTEPLFTYTGDALPSADDGWSKGYEAFEPIGARIENGALHITDAYAYNGSAIHYLHEWQELAGYVNVAEFDVQVVTIGGVPYGPGFPVGYVAIYIGTSDGNNNMLYTLFPDRILSSYGYTAPGGGRAYALGASVLFDTTSRFNTYRTVIKDGIAQLFINGDLVLEQQAGDGNYDIHGVQFGAGSSPGTGEAYFDEVRAYRQSLSVDVQLAIAPRALNIRSNGRWVSATLEVPAGYDVNEIDPSTVRLQNAIHPDLAKTEIVDARTMTMKFDRADLQNSVGDAKKAEIVITGEFRDGTAFIGRDSIKVIH